jgi:hypothetical protein
MRTALATLQQLASEAEALPAAVPERADIEVRTACCQVSAAAAVGHVQTAVADIHAVQGVYVHASDRAVLSSSRASFSALSLIINTI